MIVGSVVVANLMYLVGALVLALVLSLVVILRHRKPKSVEANMATFHRGLRALAPDDRPAAKRPDPGGLAVPNRTVPNRTVPNRTVPNRTGPPPPASPTATRSPSAQTAPGASGIPGPSGGALPKSEAETG